MFVFLTNLQARQVGESQLHLVFVQEVLGDSALHSLTIVKLQGERLHLSWPPCDIAYPVFPPHLAAMVNFDLEAFDLLGKLDPLGIGEWLPLIIDVTDVENFAHEVNHRLSLIKCSSRDVNVEVHLPLRWAD